MVQRELRWLAAVAAFMLTTTYAVAQAPVVSDKAAGAVRIATYNVSLNRPAAGALARDLAMGDSQATAVAAVIRAVRPDILLLNEIDYDADADNAQRFERIYLAAAKRDKFGSGPWPLPHHFSARVNTGVLSELDINGDGKIGLPDDGWGYGKFPGQYGMAVLSRFTIDENEVQTLQEMLWSRLPSPVAPIVPETSLPFYDETTWQKLRIASKSFWDVPVRTPLGTIHVLASHPTPPAFDGPEDRNGCRNHDEIELIARFIDSAQGLLTDRGEAAGLKPEDAFVVVGDLNSDPMDGGSRHLAIRRLLAHSRIAQFDAPASPGALTASAQQAKANLTHQGDAGEDTADFNDRSVGNLRVDYVLPSSNFEILASGVFWPDLAAAPSELREAFGESLAASDHRLVWVDIRALPEAPNSGIREKKE